MLLKSLDSKVLDRLICSMNGAAELTEVYEALTRQLSEVSAELGYHCRKGCGACCQGKSGDKEVSVFEMIPMAVEMVRNGSAEKILEKLDSMEDCDEQPCINYVDINHSEGLGHCGGYTNRPFVCRLFGDSIYLAKNDKKELLACHWLKTNYDASVRAKLETRLPLISEETTCGRSIDPILGERILGINSALSEALKIVLNKAEFIEEAEAD